MKTQTTCDVIVIGAGPAGAAAATVLAENGLRVVVFEKARHPRYHIGESLLPFTFEPLRRLGLIERMRASQFIKKHSVQFVSTSGRASQPFYFSTRYGPDIAQTWQVLRSEFDLLLVENARTKGAVIHEETTVTALLREGGRVSGVAVTDRLGQSTTWTAPLTIDASGRDAVAATQHNWRVRDPLLNKVAVWTYYRGAQRDAGIDAGATTVAFVPEKGWFWYIPQHNDLISVGVVAEGRYLTRDGVRAPREIFHREVGENAWIRDHLAPGQSTGDYHLTSEFSYRSRFGASHGLVLVGDAFGFLDPVFSSGVMLALKSGILAADAAVEAFAQRDFSADRFAGYTAVLHQGIENMRKLVCAFYEPNFSFRTLTDQYPDLNGPITDCLSGDVNKDFSRLFQAIAEFVNVPAPLPYGSPEPAPTPATVTA
jgi:flavin-dependent dehydrogenase